MKGHLVIEGGQRLKGKFFSSGAKNSVLFLITAALLYNKKIEILNVPLITDIDVMVSILKKMDIGIEYLKNKNKLMIYNQKNMINYIDPHFAQKIRASVALMCPLIYRFHRVEVPFPGGDKIGERSLDELFRAFALMGIKIVIAEDRYILTRNSALKPFNIKLKCKSHTVTMCLLMMASVIGEVCLIENYSSELDIYNLIDMLKLSGVYVAEDGKNTLIVKGTQNLKCINIQVIPDRIEIASYVLAALVTNGSIILTKDDFQSMDSAFIEILKQLSVSIEENASQITIYGNERYKNFDLETNPSPGLSTDLQNMFVVLANKCTGVSKIKENVFSERFKQLEDISRLGFNLIVKDKTVYIEPVKVLKNNIKLFCKDIRGGFSLILAALQLQKAQKVYIYNVDIIERGYSNFIEKFSHLGIHIMMEA